MSLPSIRAAWDASTAYKPEQWTPDNPARGQCAVTALLVHDLLGGDILSGFVGRERHYWNRLADGRLVDLTWDQYGGISREIKRVTLSDPRRLRRNLGDRYARLQERVGVL